LTLEIPSSMVSLEVSIPGVCSNVYTVWKS
jgi:hypothetical protein